MAFSVNPLVCITILLLVNNIHQARSSGFGQYLGFYLNKLAETFKINPIMTTDNQGTIPQTDPSFSLPNAPVIPPIEQIAKSDIVPEVIEPIDSSSQFPPVEDIFATIKTAPLQPLASAHLSVSSGLIKPPGVASVAQTFDQFTQCNCVPFGTCLGLVRSDESTRIVTQTGVTSCGTGFQLCCTQQGASQISATCGLQNIIAGVNPQAGQANFGQFPWSAIILSPRNTFIGGAALIDSTHLLTAAHLVASFGNGAGYKVRLGEWDLQGTYEPQPAIEIPIANIIIHPSYIPSTLQHDLAIITLQSAAPEMTAPAPQVNSICLPSTGESFIGQSCFVAGWGKDSFTGTYQNIIKQVSLPILSATDCQSRLQQTRLGPSWQLDTTSFICAGGEASKDACQGDGGTALACNRNGRYYVVGITAGGVQCGLPGVPGLYVNIVNYLSWINANAPTIAIPSGGIDPRRAG